MFDRKSDRHVVVSIDEVYGPYFEIFSEVEPLWLEEILQGKFYLPYWVVKRKADDAFTILGYYFGAAADPEKLQRILDVIDFEAYGNAK
ncbi:hypothetical protein ACW9IB_07415 [Pseudomonas sp. SDO524_S393]